MKTSVERKEEEKTKDKRQKTNDKSKEALSVERKAERRRKDTDITT